jgi:general secretion pathway protein F
MPAYHFIAINHAGQEQKGVIEAESEKHARQLLRDKTFIPIKINAAQKKQSVNQSTSFKLFSRKPGLSSKDIALITRQLATLLSAGLPIEETLRAVAEQTEKQQIKGLIFSVRSKVMEGHALATAMSEHPEAFSDLYCATVAAGEKTGHLDKVLMRLADYTEQQWQMRQKLKTALIYPSMIVLVAVGIVGFLLEYVVPKMIAVYGHLDQELPLMTEILIATSQWVKNDGLYAFIFIVITFFACRYALKRSVILREKFHRLLLRLPLIGYFIKTANTSRFSRTLSILSAAGVSILEAMNISAKLITSIPIQKSVGIAVNNVREGGSIHLALKQTGYFSPMSIHMIASGEASGKLEDMLERVSKNQEDEITRLIEVSLALFEPAVILLMGAIVLFIVLAVLLPIFNLNEFTG